jgi:hypothetical protein
MGTAGGGESNFSFQTIARIATAISIPLSSLLHDLEVSAKTSKGKNQRHTLRA